MCNLLCCAQERNTFWIMKQKMKEKYEKFINMFEDRRTKHCEIANRRRNEGELNIMHSYVNCIIIQLHKSYLISFLAFFDATSLIMRTFKKGVGKLHRLSYYDNIYRGLSQLADSRMIFWWFSECLETDLQHKLDQR